MFVKNRLFWMDKHNYTAITHPLFAKQLSFPYNIYYIDKRRKRMEIMVKTTKKSQQQMELDAIQVISTICTIEHPNLF